MKRSHLTLADIATPSPFANDDPRYHHLEACARCRMLRTRYLLFLSPPDDLPPDDLRDAEARLAEMLAEQVAPTAAAEPPQPAEGVRARSNVLRLPTGFRAAALAVAAAAVVVAGAFVGRGVNGPRDRASGVMRGAVRERAGGEIRQLAPSPAGAGRVRLGWRSVPAADRYEVHLYSAELRELAVLGAARETTLVLSPGAVTGAAAGDTLLWRVVALRGEVTVARSGPGMVRLP